ncbi:MAG: class I SAM-dependent methyltransferase [Chloroflexota bacterium]
MSSYNSNSPISRALRLYDDHPPGIRTFVRTRHLLCPLSAVEQQVPERGRILDLGCGHGLFSALMAVASPERSILGVDPSAAKIDTAARLSSKLPNVEFRRGTVDDCLGDRLAAITIVDVLYLLPRPEKLRILQRCRELLAPEGRLILKTNDTHPAWKYRWARLQEVIMTRLGLTLSTGGLYFLSCAETMELLRQVGFQDVRVHHLPTLLPYPHTLFVCS